MAQPTDEELLGALRRLEAEIDAYPSIAKWHAWPDRICNEKTIRQRFGSWPRALELAGISRASRPCITSEACSEALRSFYRERGASPTVSAWSSYARSRGLMSERPITDTLGEGSWSRALEAAGLPPNEPIRTPSGSFGRNRQTTTGGASDVHPHLWESGSAVETISTARG